MSELNRQVTDERTAIDRGCSTERGLRIQAALDTDDYPLGLGIKVTNHEMESLRIKRDKFHGDWNYVFISNMA